ncbi:discoidin domain-containing protein [Sunxiuqinia sp. A32]|uniref:discoidin domain-containing protein n=1 Tax=Sunxiuqinia sp. A32 TaxID=3461496 RepID=UPI0040458AFB
MKFICIIILVAISFLNSFPQEFPTKEMPLKVIDANEWDGMFKRTNGSGWYSGDGIFSIPFNGNDNIGSSSSTKTFWLFSDSHICFGIDPVSYVVTGDKMMNHSVAVLPEKSLGVVPTFNDMQYIWGDKGDYTKSNIFGERMWALDGLSVDGNIYMFMLAKTGGTNTGINRVQIPIVNDMIDLQNYEKIATPFFYSDNNTEIRLGAAIMDNTLEGGAFSPDGFIYQYGFRRANSGRQLIVARIEKKNFAKSTFSDWLFWNGNEWVQNSNTQSFESAFNSEKAQLAGDMSDRFSVTPIKTGIYANKYLLIYMKGLSDPVIVYRVSDSPVGPWSDAVPLYSPLDDMEAMGIDSVNYYGAKAHPHLSDEGELLVSYCANKEQKTIKTNDKNRGRFFRVKLDEKAQNAPLYIVSNYHNATSASSSTSGNPASAAFNFTKKASQVSKWQSVDSDEDDWVSIDLGTDLYISQWQVINAGAKEEGASLLNTRDFKLQKSDNNKTWITVDEVIGNTDDVTMRKINEQSARYWRLYITKPSQDGSGQANIYSFNLYGRTNPAVLTGSGVKKND